MHDKSEDSAKVNNSFQSLEVFRQTSILNTSSDMHGSARKIHLEAKSMKPKFDVGAKKSKFSEDVNLVNKSEDSAKVSRLFASLEVIRYTFILYTPSNNA